MTNDNPPQPGDYCQWREFDGEVIDCDGETVWIDLVDEGEQVAIRYIPDHWA